MLQDKRRIAPYSNEQCRHIPHSIHQCIFLTRYVSNQITLTLDFSPANLISPNIADEDLPSVDAMIWPSFQSEPQLGH
jgi:hypothetical protein